MIKKNYIWLLLSLGTLVVTVLTGSNCGLAEATPVESLQGIKVEEQNYFRISVDPFIHEDYGCGYPVSYGFSIPPGSSELQASKKYALSESWTLIEEKTSSDFFNGVEAVRFDYVNSKAYLSVAFSDRSDDIFLKITSLSGYIKVTYDEITRYYDNRDAAVVFSADDWDGDPVRDSKFQQTCDIFTSKKIWLSVSVVTEGISDSSPPNWANIQGKIDAGYIEVASHSRNHQLPPYNYDSEIGGSKDDIVNNLNLPASYKMRDQEYVWGWIAPYSQSGSAIRSRLGQYKYLSEIAGPKDTGNGYFPSWNPVYGLYQTWNRWTYMEYRTVDELNNKFDKRINAGKIYHLGFHPTLNDFSPGTKADQHTDYVKERKNLWYVGVGALMMYHYVDQGFIVTVREVIAGLDKVFAYPNPCYLAKGQKVTIADLPLDVDSVRIYSVSGQLVKTLQKGNGIEEGMSSATATWDCRNDYGEETSRGIYVYIVSTTTGKKGTGKIAVIK